jgi:uncharacterized membrane-anchored protein
MHAASLRAVGAVVCLWAGLAVAAEPPTPDQRHAAIAALPWSPGPVGVDVGSRARLQLPKGQAFLTERDSAKFLEMTGNLPEPGESILMADRWWAALDFADVGFVKDDEKLDADELLKQLKSADEPGNAERKKLGMAALYTDGWVVPPHYDAQTRHLEFGLKLHAEGSNETIINYTVRLLGRTGYENVVLVSAPETLDADVQALKATLAAFDFNSGEKYSEFKQGDRIAEFGLGALVVGGAAAALVKTGFWKTILVALAAGWKLVVGVGVALLAGIGRLFKRKGT